MQAFDYIFNVGGDYTANINGMTSATGEFTAKVNGATSMLSGLHTKLAVFDLVSGYVERVSGTLDEFSQAGKSLDSQMHDLSAVAGVTGQGLSQIETYARKSALAFGTDAGTAVEGYKLLLSQLSPELGKYPKALQEMGKSIQTTSKLMGNDGTAAAEVLTTAMNQYGVSLSNPYEASKRMAEMMNVMAAAGQAGSAELPAIKVALEQCGMAAKSANVSFEETNAAIQVLDKAGKKGSEGGVALRNTLSIISQGRFMPKETRDALEAAGIDVVKLADNSKSLKERLEMLKPIMNDAALFSKLFGMENANAARALVGGTDELGRFTKAVTGTKSAEEQAAIVMDSYAEKEAREKQKIEDLKISFFEFSHGLTMWVGAATSVLVPVSQMIPLFMGLGKAMLYIRNIQFASMLASVTGWLRRAAVGMVLMTDATALNNGISLGFIGNIGRATIALLRFGTVGIWQGIKALGAFLLSLVTTGTASATFAGISATAFGAFRLSAVSACRAVGIAIMNIPIVGWIAAAIAALVAIGIYFWNTSAKFRAVLKGLWAAFKATFTGIGNLAKNTFGAIGELLQACFNLSPSGISTALNKLKAGFSDYGKQIGKAFKTAYDEEMAASSKQPQKKQQQKQKSALTTPTIPTTPQVPSPISAQSPDPTAGTASKGGGSSAGAGSDKAIRNVTINVERLVDKFEVHTATLNESADRVKDVVAQALLSALNDVNISV